MLSNSYRNEIVSQEDPDNKKLDRRPRTDEREEEAPDGHPETLLPNARLTEKNREEAKDPIPFWQREIFTVPVKSLWPAPVTCRMNIEEWAELMKEVGLEKDIPYIANGFKFGFCLGIPQHEIEGLPWYTPENHKSALVAKEQIELTLEKEKKAGRILGPFSHEEVRERFGFFRSNPMGGAVNGDGSIRMVNDLSHPKNEPNLPSVNSFVNKLNYGTHWDDFDKVALFFQENPGEWELAIFDWQKAYRQLPVHPSQRRFLCIQDFDGMIWVDLAVGFGGVASCGVFGAPAHVWKIIMERLLGFKIIFRWVDDNLIIRKPGDLASLADVTTLSNSLGVETNPSKNHDFSSEQRYVGFIWNAKDHSVRLPEEKLKERRQLIEDLLEEGKTWSFHSIESLIGKLAHTVYIVPHMKAYMRSFYRWLKDWVNKAALRQTPIQVKSDLEEWKTCLQSFNTRPLIPSPAAIDVKWVGDASSSFGIGVLIDKHWACFELSTNWQTLSLQSGKRSIAWAETVAICLGLIVLNKLRRVAGGKFWVWTDNTTTQSAIEKRKSKDEHVNNEWKYIQRLLTCLACDIAAKRVTSKGNEADALSRGDLGELFWFNEVRIEIPVDLKHVLKQVVPPKKTSKHTQQLIGEERTER